MTYTEIGVVAVLLAVVIDLLILRTRVVAGRTFWLSYAIIIVFQLLTNGVLTGLRIVTYDPAFIVGAGDYREVRPPFIGDGRLAFAPVEDLLFGFAMILLTLSMWVWWGARGVQRTPYSGPPPRWWPRGGILGVSRAVADPAVEQPGARSALGGGQPPPGESGVVDEAADVSRPEPPSGADRA